MTPNNLRLVIAIGLVILLLLGGWLVATRRAPAASTVVVQDCSAGDCAVFPQVTGRNLAGDEVTLPDFFDGEISIVVMPFSQDQQVAAADWLPLVQQLADEHAAFRYYNVAAMPAVNPALRTMISGGMAAAVPDDELKAIIVTLFLEDVDIFTAALDIESTDALALLLLDAEGGVLWQGAGTFDDALADEIRAEVAARLE